MKKIKYFCWMHCPGSLWDLILLHHVLFFSTVHLHSLLNYISHADQELSWDKPWNIKERVWLENQA